MTGKYKIDFGRERVHHNILILNEMELNSSFYTMHVD